MLYRGRRDIKPKFTAFLLREQLWVPDIKWNHRVIAAHLESSFLWIILWLLRVSVRSLLTMWPIFRLSHCCRFLNLLRLREYFKKVLPAIHAKRCQMFLGRSSRHSCFVTRIHAEKRVCGKAERKNGKQKKQTFSASLSEWYQHARGWLSFFFFNT